MPFLLDVTRGEHGTLVGHVARANPVWRTFDPDRESVVIFQGADRYITPSWYPSKREHQKVVPTWNYAVVHAHGRPAIVEDVEWLRRHVTEMVDRHEAEQEVPWRVTDAPDDYIAGLLTGIVGIEISIRRLVGKWKTSQNRTIADRNGVLSGLQEATDDASREMATYVKRALEK